MRPLPSLRESLPIRSRRPFVATQCPFRTGSRRSPETYTYPAKRYTFTYTMMRRVRVRAAADPSDHCRNRNRNRNRNRDRDRDRGNRGNRGNRDLFWLAPCLLSTAQTLPPGFVRTGQRFPVSHV
ncbi:MAG: hypothetical protein ACOX52_13765 [Verrucomicrobiota bacterium]